MPRKAKEKELELNNLIKGAKKEVDSSKTTEKKTATKKTTTKKSVAPKSTVKKSASQTSAIKQEPKAKKQSSISKSKVATSIVSSKKTNASTVTSSTSKKNTSKAKSTKKTSYKAPTIVEYYDLPFRYNQTVVKILAQTPNILFIYWDISDEDKNGYMQKYGPDFFEHTKPYLIITNQTMHYTFEVEINDFANSWYLHINDADCEYKVELGRKFITNSTHTLSNELDSSSHFKAFVNYVANDYLPITSSNETQMPNNHILFDKLGKSVFFRNVKTNIMNEKDISSLSFFQKIGKVYHIYDLYKEIYKDELISDEFGFNLPSSNCSSSFK